MAVAHGVSCYKKTVLYARRSSPCERPDYALMVRTPARRAGSHTSRCFWVRRAFVVACVSGALPATHPGATQPALALWVLGQIMLESGSASCRVSVMSYV